MSEAKRIVKLLFLILIAGLLGGCVKPCEIDWYQGCPENTVEKYKADTEMNELYQQQRLKERQNEVNESQQSNEN